MSQFKFYAYFVFFLLFGTAIISSVYLGQKIKVLDLELLTANTEIQTKDRTITTISDDLKKAQDRAAKLEANILVREKENKQIKKESANLQEKLDNISKEYLEADCINQEAPESVNNLFRGKK